MTQSATQTIQQMLIDPGMAWQICRDHCEWISFREWEVASLRFEEACEIREIAKRLGLPESDVAEVFQGLMAFVNEIALETLELNESA